ncbi:carbohydrate ABC transporter permease [Cohnella sp. AR92]|uniref:carbohydrate ABC transporter permease n=1 Tax=Cohnella sp. AR92 TaxID=648716 RepID=UPI000F8DB26A|nr:sugar ABC transporter permease [Cohnella sp. AR92]RUS46219.1 sugar ABC transporter permease [Cohnella sp. AR92]
MRSIRHWLNGWNRPEKAAYLFIAPALAVLLLFTVVPLIATLVISTLDMDVFLQVKGFIGLDHFERLFQDDRLIESAKHTLYFAGIEVPLQIILALLTAVYVSRNTRYRKFLRSVYFVPSICSFTAIGIVASFLLDPQTGVYPSYLENLGLPRLEFFRDPSWAMPSVIALTAWRSFGYSMIILVAGIQSIPESYYEAAQLDGAGKAKQFFAITIPMLMPSLSFCVITTTIAAMQVFDQIFVTTQGGPLNKTETIVGYIYNTGFKMAPYDLGYASAISVLLFVAIMAITLLMNRYFLRREADLA